MAGRIIAVVLFSLALCSTALSIDEAPAFDDPILLARYQHLTRELRCLVCQNETIADSNVQLAGDLRRELRGLLAQGKTDEEALKFLTDRYGDFVLYDPPLTSRTIILWSAPALALLIAFTTAFIVIRRRARMPIDDEPDTRTTLQ